MCGERGVVVKERVARVEKDEERVLRRTRRQEGW